MLSDPRNIGNAIQGSSFIAKTAIHAIQTAIHVYKQGHSPLLDLIYFNGQSCFKARTVIFRPSQIK